LLVLDRHASGEHSENIPQNTKLDIRSESAIGLRRDGLQVVFVAALHDLELAKVSCSFG
jgi:hypothetical protein